jgi:ribonuclease-3
MIDVPGPDAYSALEGRLGHPFADRSLLVRALTHTSFANEASPGSGAKDNETLEFLGDSVLGFLVAEALYNAWPDFREGALSKARSHLVSESHFASLARRLEVGPLIRLAQGESHAGGRVRDSLLADVFEALFAAIYLDGGLEAARAIAQRFFANDIAALDPEELLRRDYKTALQELAQAEGKPLPVYRLLEESGPSHERTFVYEVAYGDALRATGAGLSKKDAQREAARSALERLAGGR